MKLHIKLIQNLFLRNSYKKNDSLLITDLPIKNLFQNKKTIYLENNSIQY